jgi:hypothetical protein
MTTAEISQFVNTVGIPGSLIVFGCFIAWRWGWWTLTEVVKPVAVKAIDFMEHLTVQGSELVASTKRMCDGLEQVTKKQVEHDRRFADLHQAIKSKGEQHGQSTTKSQS